jgi:universal stress protein A
MSSIRRILVPVDFSEPSRAALDYAATVARAFGATLDLLHVWEVPSFVPPGTTLDLGAPVHSLVETVRGGAEEALKQLVSDATGRGLPIGSARAEPGSPAHSIVEAAKAGSYDLIVIGTNGRTGLSRALIGSVAERVVRLAPCPVLAVRTPG